MGYGQIPGNLEETKIHDASFSPDGSRISVTDSFGRVSILGLDNPARYKDVALEQYYSTDYHDIMMYVRVGWDVQSMYAFNCRVDFKRSDSLSCASHVGMYRHHYIQCVVTINYFSHRHSLYHLQLLFRYVPFSHLKNYLDY
jgi:hypothetical protein